MDRSRPLPLGPADGGELSSGVDGGHLWHWGGGEGRRVQGWVDEQGQRVHAVPTSVTPDARLHPAPATATYESQTSAGPSNWAREGAVHGAQHWPPSSTTGYNGSSTVPHLSAGMFYSPAYAPGGQAHHAHPPPDYAHHHEAYPQPYTAQQAGLPFAHLPSHPPSAAHHQYLHPPPPTDAELVPNHLHEPPRSFQKRRLEEYPTVEVETPPFSLGAPSNWVAQLDGTGSLSHATSQPYLHGQPFTSGSVALPQAAEFEPALPPNLEANYAVYAPSEGAPSQQGLWYLPDAALYQSAPGGEARLHPSPGRADLPQQFNAYVPDSTGQRQHSYAPAGPASTGVPSRASSAASSRDRPTAALPRTGLDPFSRTRLGTPEPLTSSQPPPPSSVFTIPAPSTPSGSSSSRSAPPPPTLPVPPAPSATGLPGRAPSPSLESEGDEQVAQVVALASIRRALHETLPPPLAYKPARGAAGHAKSPSNSKTSTGRMRLTAFSRAPDRESEALEERDLLRSRGKVNRNQQKEVSSVEVLARCATCTVVDPSGAVEPRTLARLVLRAIPPHLVEALERGATPSSVVRIVRTPDAVDLGASCWACLGAREGDEGVIRAGAQSHADGGTATSAPHRKSVAPAARQSKTYDATLSAAIDKLEQLGLEGAADAGSPSASPGSSAALGMSPRQMEREEAARAEHSSLLLMEPARAPAQCKSGWLRCDVCDFICGVGTAVSAVPGPPAAPSFTVEVICARCAALFRCCSDCGGGGGRLTPGRWRCKELFPDGRKTCQLSHARNPALGEVTIEVLSVSEIPPAQLDVLESRCRAIYFNSRLAVVARPEFLLRGDGLARSFREAEAVTVDHWGQLATVLRDPPPEGRTVKRYITGMYSTPRKRHPKRGKGKDREGGSDASSRPVEKTAFGFSITEVDFDHGLLFFCCVMPWPVNGQAFDATTILGEATTQRAKADRLVLNQQRALANPPLPRLPPLTYNYIASPFRVGSRANAGLARRGYETLEELEQRDPGLRREWFRVGWLPDKYAAALTIFVRRLESEEDLGGPPTENAPRKRVRKAGTSMTTTPTAASSASPAASGWSNEPGGPYAGDAAPFLTSPLGQQGYQLGLPQLGQVYYPLPQPPQPPHGAPP